MSENTENKPIALKEAESMASELIEYLRPLCQRIEVAGSVRRLKNYVNDIEIVLIPRPIQGLFGDLEYSASQIREALQQKGFEIVKGGVDYIQAKSRTGVLFNIFITDPDRWGCVFTIRTGSAAFTRRLVTTRNEGGVKPNHLAFVGGRIADISQGGKFLDTPEEKDVFDTLGLPWVKPWERF